jgi:hypothetical protein
MRGKIAARKAKDPTGLIRFAMADDEVVFTIDGRDVHPDSVSVGDLAYVLDNFERAVKAVATANGDDPESILITLDDIREGSGTYALKANNPARAHATTIALAIDQRDSSLLPPNARRYISNVHGRGRTKNWSFGISGKSRNGSDFRAIIRPNTQLFDAARTFGATSVVATVIKAGGEAGRRVAELRLADGDYLTAKVASHDLAVELGHCLFKEVELIGRAIWNTDNWRLYKFTITEIGPYRKESSNPALAIEQLREVTGGFWDSINVTQYMNGLRGDDNGITQ